MADLISQLPNELLHNILLNLSTNESVRTSVLSTRWRHLWQSVPGIIFKGYKHDDVTDFLDRFLNLNKDLSIYKFTLSRYVVDVSLIDQILTRRRVQLLKIWGSKNAIFELPVSFYTCATLVNLSLKYVKLGNFDGEFINLPRLQVMGLHFVSIASDVVLEMLISCSPVLQKLILSGIGVGRVKIRSQTLRRLSLNGICKNPFELWGDGGGGECRVVIDTPNLECLRMISEPLENFRVENVNPSIKICIDVSYSNMQNLHKFFAGISCVTFLSISGRTLDTMYETYSKALQHQQLPEFQKLTHLCGFLVPGSSKMFPLFLSSCPNLKYIELLLHGYPKMEEITNSLVPQCLQTSIEYVKIIMAPMRGEERSPKVETEFAKYILENGRALKNFTLWVDEENDVCSSVLEQILTFRNNPFVEVKILRPTWDFRKDDYTQFF